MNIKKIISILVFSLFITGFLFAFETSEILWRYSSGGRIITPPVEGSDGIIYFCSEDRYLYALKSDGSLLWRNNLEDRITETLAIGSDGTLYAGSKRGFIIAVNPMGESLWKVKLKGSLIGNPAISPDGSLFIATNEGWLYSLSHTGFIRWEVKLPGLPVLGPVLGAEIYVALNNERIYSYNIDGSKQWTFLLSGNAKSLVLSIDNLYVGTDNSTLVSIDFSGTRNWNQSLNGHVTSIIVLTEDRIVCTSGKNIIMLDSSGNNIWIKSERTSQIDLKAYSNLIVSLGSEGSVSWFDMDGLPVSTIKGGAPVQRFLGASDGNILVGSKDWLLYKFGLNNIVSDNYLSNIWPGYGGVIGNRGYLLTNKIDQNINERYQSSDYVYLTELSNILDEQTLNVVLDEIELRLYNRDYNKGKTYLVEILEFLASDCITRPLYKESLLINNFPVVRSRAVDILGIIGSLKTIEFLVGLLNFEWDDYVINSIFRALGNLQSDKDRNISNGISSYYNNQKNINTRSLSQILLTVEKLDSYNGTSSRELLAVITNIFLTSSSRATKELALDTINSIKK